VQQSKAKTLASVPLLVLSFSRSRAEGTPNKQTSKQANKQTNKQTNNQSINQSIKQSIATHGPSQQNEQASHYVTRYTIPISLIKDPDDTVTVSVLS
jgi:hypothetical protein